MQFTVPRLIKDKHQHFSILFYAQGKRYRVSNGKKFGVDLHLNTGNILGEDLFGFNALPFGQRITEGYFSVFGHDAQFWTSTPNPLDENAIYRSLHSNIQGINRGENFSLKWMGKSVRCIKD